MLTIFGYVIDFTAMAVKGANIMLNKPSTQTGSRHVSYHARQANDGNTATYSYSYSSTLDTLSWQGDLLGFYTVSRITVTSSADYGYFLSNATIGVSSRGITCSEDDFVLCGQWPDATLNSHIMTFNCTVPGPVRFVRIWRERIYNPDYLAIAEVQVKGTPNISKGNWFNTYTMTQVTAPTTKLTVPRRIDCGVKCHQIQPCLAFSFNPKENPNCFLASDTTTRTLAEWVTYKIPDCFKTPTCNNTG